MTDKRDNDPDRLGEKWLNGWENQSMEEWERDSNVEEIIHRENEQKTAQKLWLSFQNSASTIAQMYKEGTHPNCISLWVPFQNSASSVTSLYKDSQDSVRQSYDHGSQQGYRRRTKELLAWVKKRRCNHIRREDLIAFLCGKSAPVRHARHHLHHRAGGSPGMAKAPGSNARLMLDSRGSPRALPIALGEQEGALGGDDHRQEPDLQPFRDALALQGLSGAMSNISVGHQQDGESTVEADPTQCANVTSPTTPPQGAGGVGDDFHCFILDEMSRRGYGSSSRKRPGCTGAGEGRMDSPSRKRMRLWQDHMDEEDDLC